MRLSKGVSSEVCREPSKVRQYLQIFQVFRNISMFLKALHLTQFLCVEHSLSSNLKAAVPRALPSYFSRIITLPQNAQNSHTKTPDKGSYRVKMAVIAVG